MLAACSLLCKHGIVGGVLVILQFSAFPSVLAATSISFRAVCCLPGIDYGKFFWPCVALPRVVADGRPLTCQLLSCTVQSLLRSAGYADSYSGHSFPIGAATIASSWGLPDYPFRTFVLWFCNTHLLDLHISWLS